MVAVVIMAETLLAENTFAFRNDYKLNDRQEILACAAGNIVAAAVGCCPVNGSISAPPSMNSTVEISGGFHHCRDHHGSDPSFRHRFYRISSSSCTDSHCDLCSDGCGGNPSGCTSFQSKPYRILHLHAAGFSVLCLGTIYGVIIGILLSFVAVILKPPTAALLPWYDPGRDAYFDLSKNRFAYPIKAL